MVNYKTGDDSLCPICRNADFEILGSKCVSRKEETRDVFHFDCDICGEFNISGEALVDLIEDQENFNQDQRAAISHSFKINTRKGLMNIVRKANLKHLFRFAATPGNSTQILDLICYIGNGLKKTRGKLAKLPIDIHSILGSLNRHEVIKLVQRLRDSEILDCNVNSNGDFVDLSLTEKGNSKYNEISERRNKKFEMPSWANM